MLFVSVLRNALLILVPLSITLTTYLYLYPIFHLCAFPSPAGVSYLTTVLQHIPFLPQQPTASAPFRLLAIGDPQLEGDTSLNPNAASFPNLAKFWKDAWYEGKKHGLRERTRLGLHDLVDFYFEDIPNIFSYYRKRLDLLGNDYYLAHIYRTLHWWTNPTHVSVLGDLVGSQWISDAEFESRGNRYWNRVFKHGKRVEDELAFQPGEIEFGKPQVLGEDAAWSRRIINIAGNHDIGYAGDLTPGRLSRFERVFGKANYELRFRLPESNNSNASEYEGKEWINENNVLPEPELRIVVLNDMNLDGPILSKDLQEQTYAFLNDIIKTSQPVTQRAHFTLILTHIPLYKPAGICVDGPFFDYHTNPSLGTGIKEQNHLSMDASKGFLEGLLGMSGNKEVDGGGMGRRGLIVNGHDHEGCDVWHFINQTIPIPETEAASSPDPEVTIPSPEIETKVEMETSSGTEVAIETGTETETDAAVEIETEEILMINTDQEPDNLLVQIPLTPDSPPGPDPNSDPKNPEIPDSSPITDPEPQPIPSWQTMPYFQITNSSLPLPGTREITLRSIMGEYHGTAGLLSLSYNSSTHDWEYEFSTCAAGKQHLWWIVHVLDLVTLGVCGVWAAVVLVEMVDAYKKSKKI